MGHPWASIIEQKPVMFFHVSCTDYIEICVEAKKIIRDKFCLVLEQELHAIEKKTICSFSAVAKLYRISSPQLELTLKVKRDSALLGTSTRSMTYMSSMCVKRWCIR